MYWTGWFLSTFIVIVLPTKRVHRQA
jgi:hypothetical protein